MSIRVTGFRNGGKPINRVGRTVDLDLAGFEGKNLNLKQPYKAASVTGKVFTDGTADQVCMAEPLRENRPQRILRGGCGGCVRVLWSVQSMCGPTRPGINASDSFYPVHADAA